MQAELIAAHVRHLLRSRAAILAEDKEAKEIRFLPNRPL